MGYFFSESQKHSGSGGAGCRQVTGEELFHPFGSLTDGGEMVCDVPFDLSPIGRQPAEVFHQAEAGKGEGSNDKDQFHESAKRPPEKKSSDITSAESRHGQWREI